MDVIKKMQDAQKRAVDQIWSRRASGLPLHSPYELVTLASIVEKETGKADERPRVASVFLNRLRNRMRLQSDPTIVYGLAGGKGSLGRGITRAELEKPTPYNTYLIDGLPPGPIANPGRAALEAVANPSRTQDLYFVADGTGGHVFAETLDQHSRNVQRWRQIEKDAKDKQEQPPPDDGQNRAGNGPGGNSARRRPEERQRRAAVRLRIAASVARRPAKRGARTALAFLCGAASAIAGAMRFPPSKTVAAKTTAKTNISAFTFGPGLDELGISVGGVRAPAAATLDGPISQDDTADAAGQQNADFPSPAGRRAGQEARAAGLGLRRGTGDLPEESGGPRLFAPPRPQIDGQPAHARAFDVSEGTPLDPLRNKTYDLNYAKTVPSIQ